MTSDRLRTAADRLDERITYWQGSVVTRDQDTATAALLRAIAEGHELQDGEPFDGPCDCPDWKAALALADAVLGPTSVGDSELNSNTDDETCGGCEHPRDRHDNDEGCIECKCWRYVP